MIGPKNKTFSVHKSYYSSTYKHNNKTHLINYLEIYNNTLRQQKVHTLADLNVEDVFFLLHYAAYLTKMETF